MAPRASWKGFLTIGALSCAVGLYAAASTAERIALNLVNRKTGHRLRRQYVDEETGQPVEGGDQVKGYEVEKGAFVTLEPEEVASVVPQGDKTIAIAAFLPCDGIDTLYLDRPYFLAPVDAPGAEAFALIAAGMQAAQVAALGEAVLFRRVRKLLIRPGLENGALLADTLNFDYEVRPAEEAFAGIPEVAVTGEMVDLATHIIRGKSGAFDPAAFDDRYEAALAELVRAKMEGRTLPKARTPRAAKVVDLLDALRASAGAAGGAKKPAPKGTGAKARAAGGKAKAGAKAAARPAPRSGRKAG